MSTYRPEDPDGTEPTRAFEPYPSYEPTQAFEQPSGYEPTRALEPYAEPAPTYAQQNHPQPAYPQQGYPQPAYPQQPWAAGPPPGYPAVDPRWQSYQAGLYAAQKSRVAAGLLGLFLGGLGIHNFYLGRTGVAVVQLLMSLLSLGILAPVVGIWALIESIMILAGASSFRTDAKGIPLRD